MISRRSTIIVALVFVPVLIYAILGGYALWTTGVLRWMWWLGPASWTLAWALARFWSIGHKTADPADTSAPSFWTPRDDRALEIVRTFQSKVDKFTPPQLADLSTYRTEAQALALELARHYHPEAADVWSSVRVTELLAAVRLAIDDLEPWILNTLPGIHLLTMERGLKLRSVPKWLRRFQNAWWAASILWNPANIVGGLVVKLTGDSLIGAVQTELLASFYSRFMDRIGFYLIEMNSGRLRGGADAYRRAFPTELRAATSEPRAPQPLTVALVGQVSSGKSSLVNALVGSHQAAVDILPETKAVARYQMTLGDPAVSVTLLDTPGYGEAGATAEQSRQIRSALQQSNAVLLVMDAHSPAREADRRTIEALKEWYAGQPRLKPPPMLGVLTHVDLLRPTLEWSPPYDWRQPKGAKEESIRDAVGYVRELFDGELVEVVPICSDAHRERAWGVVDEVFPALTLILSEAQSVALLRGFERELDHDRFKTLLRQIQRCGSDLVRCVVEEKLH
jgi:predicted GTPase